MRYVLIMNSARFSNGSTSSNLEGLEIVQISADTLSDAQAAIAVAKAWLRSTGAKFKLVEFHKTIGGEFSNLGVGYHARIAYKGAR